jgi:glycosyltransferase involved in cell wall biosynthesis
LDSVIGQDFESVEIIAVNDGSTDASADVLSAYAKTCSKLKVITQENQGLGGARNTGIRAAQGEYLLFLDSDDLLTPQTALSHLYERASATDADMVCFGMNFVTEDGTVLSVYRAYETGEKMMTPESFLYEFANNSYACNKLYRTTLFQKTGILFPQRAWYEDLATIPKAILHSSKILLTDQVFHNYLQRDNSIMHCSNPDRVIEMIDAVDGVCTYYRDHEAFERYYETLEYMTALHVLVLATNRVAADIPTHPLLKRLRQYCEEMFPTFQKNTLLRTLPFRRKMIYIFSKLKCYRALRFLNKLNGLRK